MPFFKPSHNSAPAQDLESAGLSHTPRCRPLDPAHEPESTSLYAIHSGRQVFKTCVCQSGQGTTKSRMTPCNKQLETLGEGDIGHTYFQMSDNRQFRAVI